MPVVLALALVLTAPAAQAPALDDWMATLVPLVREARAAVGSRQLTIEPGTLPPSPHTGRSAALFAVRIGMDTFEVEEDALLFVDRLIAAHASGTALSAADREMAGRWVDELRRRVLADLAARREAVACDDLCIRQRLQAPMTLFDGPADERAGRRDRLLLETVSRAVRAPGLREQADELH